MAKNVGMKILHLSSETAPPLRLDDGCRVLVHRDVLTVEDMVRLQPDLVISYGYRHILKPEVLGMLPGKFINLHISLLPYNRGADPTAWGFLEGTPQGVSIHLIDAGIDTGPVLVQRELHFSEEDETLRSAYSRLQTEIQQLFAEHWEALRDGMPAMPQCGVGTFHYARQFAGIRDELLGAEGYDVPIPLLKERYRCMGGDELARLNDER
jgi:hypothetical protein